MKIFLKCVYRTVKSKKPVEHKPGEIVDLADAEAKRLIDMGAAEPAERFIPQPAKPSLTEAGNGDGADPDDDGEDDGGEAGASDES